VSECFDTHSLGTGQAIAHGYAHLAKNIKTGEKVITRHADSVLLTIEEVSLLAGHAEQNGSTLLGELCRLYMGERLSHLYVDRTKRMEIEQHTYRAAFIAGVQPEKAGVLIDAADGGTPQRFLWLPASYPHARVRPDGPIAPWPWTPPDRGPVPSQTPNPFADAAERKDRASAAPVTDRVTVPVCSRAAEAIDYAAWERGSGIGDPLDGHRLLCQKKAAAGFAILAGDAAGVADLYWQVAGRLMTVSDATRAGVMAALSAKASRENQRRGRADAERVVVVEDAKDQRATRKAPESILRILGRHGDWMARSDLRRRLTDGPIRGAFDDAVAPLLASGQLISEESTYQGQVKVRYRLAGDRG
jgi:hypothetical protein